MRSSSVAALVLSLAVSPLAAQTGMLLEVTGHAGYTAVDVKKWAGPNVNDWTQFASGGSATLFFKGAPTVKLGVEVGYRYFMWYEYPSGIGPSMYQYDVAATHYGLVARFSLVPGVSFDAGLGGYAFDGGTDVGGHAAISKSFFSGPKFSIPIGLRVDYVADKDAPLTDIGANAGLAIKF